MKIGQQRIIQAAELLGKGVMRMHAVNTDAQDLGVELREARQVFLQRAKLTSSSASEIERVEGKDNDAAANIGQLQRAGAHMGGQREVGRIIANYQFLIGHVPLLEFVRIDRSGGGGRAVIEKGRQSLQSYGIRTPPKASDGPNTDGRDHRNMPKRFARFCIG